MNDFLAYYFILAAGLCTLLFLMKPKGFILFLIAASPVINMLWVYKIGDFSVVDIFWGIFPVFFVFIALKLAAEGRWVWGRYNKYFLLMLVGFIIPLTNLATNGENITHAVELFLKMLCGFASYNLFMNLFEYREQDKIIKSVLCAVSITMSMVVFQLITGIGTHSSDVYHIKGFYHDPGQYTRMALFGIVILLPLLKDIRNKAGYLMNVLLLVSCVVTLAYSISRNVVFCAGSVVILYTLLWRRVFLAIVVFWVGLVIYFSSPVVQATYEAKFRKEIEYLNRREVPVETLGSGRVGIWQRTIEEFKKADTFEKAFGTGKHIGPHGEYFGLLRSVGVFGLGVTILLYLKLLIDSFSAIKRDKNNIIASYSLLIVIVVFIMAVGSAPISNFYLQIILFAFIGLLERIDRSKCVIVQSAGEARE